MASVVVVMLMVMMRLFASVSVTMMRFFLFMAMAVMCFLVLMAVAMMRFLVLMAVAMMRFLLMAMAMMRFLVLVTVAVMFFLVLMAVAMMCFFFLAAMAVMRFLVLASVAMMRFLLRGGSGHRCRAIEVGHIMVMIFMGCIQNDIEITARNAGFLDAGDLHHETVCRNGIQRAFQRLRVCAEVDHRCDEHISADAGGSFKV